MEKFRIRQATIEDTKIILDLITQLAIYEKMEDDVIVTEEILRENIFEKKHANVLLAEENGKIVGFALYFFNFSTFLGKPGLYLEDLFVEPNYRGKGYGKKLLIELSKIAVQKKCGRMEWIVLDWNTPSIDFYKSLGAFPLDEWTVYRLTEDKMKSLSQQ